MSKPLPTASRLSVYNGQTCIGFLIRRGKCGVEAFDLEDRSLGIFASQFEGITALTVAAKASGPPD